SMESRKLSNCVFLKILRARLGKLHCSGCSRTIASLQPCRTFTTKNNSLNSPRRQNVRRSLPTTWRRSANFTPTTYESKRNLPSSRGQWSCRRKPRQHRHEFETRSLPCSLAAALAGFAFYLADPISSVHEFTRINPR